MVAERRYHQVFIKVFLVMRNGYQSTHILLEYAVHESKEANRLVYMQSVKLLNY